MSDLLIRRDRTFAAPQYQGTAKTEKTASASQSQGVARSTGLNVAAALQEMTAKSSRMSMDIRESRRTLQVGQGVLAGVKDSLERLAELARKAAGDGEVDREALQQEMEQLRDEIGRMIGSAAVGDTPLFLEGSSDIRDVARLLVQIMEKAEAGISPDQAIQELTGGAFDSVAALQEQLASGIVQETLLDMMATSGGAALLKLLAGMQGGNLDLLMGLLSGLQTAAAGPEEAPAAPETPAAQAQAAPETPLTAKTFGSLQVTGRDLSGVAFDKKTGELTVSGNGDITVQGTDREAGAIRLTGSGTVTLRDVTGTVLTVETARVQVNTEGRNALPEVRLGEGAALTLGGEGRLELGAVRGNESNTLRLTSGAVIVKGENGETPGRLAVPVVLEGAAVLAAQAVHVTDAAGRQQEPFDLIWKALLPGWSGLTELEVDGKQTRLALLNGDPARLWLLRGDQGFPGHTLVLRGQEKSGQIRTRYAYLQWNKARGQAEAVPMYPNPFAVTGGEAEQDWVYEEETQTLRILTSQVTAVSGGSGVDANQVPFSGRIALADSIGAVELTLDNVICQVPSGRAFDLGEENQVTLILPGGVSNLFASGLGCAGITMGEGTLLCVDCPQPGEEDEAPAGTLTAAGGLGCAGIGRDGVAGWDPADPVLIRSAGREEEHSFLGPVTIAGGTVVPQDEEELPEGILLPMGERAVTLPQFHLSVQALGLSGMSLMTREYARDAQAVLEASQQRIAQLQSMYGVLYDWLDQGARSLPGACPAPVQELVRSSLQADTLLEDMRRTILLHPTQAMRTHSRREVENTIRQLLK